MFVEHAAALAYGFHTPRLVRDLLHRYVQQLWRDCFAGNGCDRRSKSSAKDKGEAYTSTRILNVLDLFHFYDEHLYVCFFVRPWSNFCAPGYEKHEDRNTYHYKSLLHGYLLPFFQGAVFSITRAYNTTLHHLA